MSNAHLTDASLMELQAISSDPDVRVELISHVPTNPSFASAKLEVVDTAVGPVRVAVQGDRSKPAILTYHDLGMNYLGCFEGFCSHAEVVRMLDYFCVYHVNAPGHIEGDAPLQQQFYPSMEQLAHTLHDVVRHFKYAFFKPIYVLSSIRSFIGIGVGAGANVLLRFHLLAPHLTDALIFVNCSAAAAGWLEWGSHQMNKVSFLRGDANLLLKEYLLWHWFGQCIDRQPDSQEQHLQTLHSLTQANVIGLVNSYVTRTDVPLSRPEPWLNDAQRAALPSLKCPAMLITGDESVHGSEVVETNSRFDPAQCSFVKLADCGGLILEEVPDKVAEAVRLFLQGLGYFPSMKPLAEVQRLAASSSKSSSNSSLNRVGVSGAASGDVLANPTHSVRSLSDTAQDALTATTRSK